MSVHLYGDGHFVTIRRHLSACSCGNELRRLVVENIPPNVASALFIIGTGKRSSVVPLIKTDHFEYKVRDSPCPSRRLLSVMNLRGQRCFRSDELFYEKEIKESRD